MKMFLSIQSVTVLADVTIDILRATAQRLTDGNYTGRILIFRKYVYGHDDAYGSTTTNH